MDVVWASDEICVVDRTDLIPARPRELGERQSGIQGQPAALQSRRGKSLKSILDAKQIYEIGGMGPR